MNTMKTFLLNLFLFISLIGFSQVTPPANLQNYYSSVDFTKTGTALKAELIAVTLQKHSNILSYSEVWDASKITDEDPNNTNNVILIYGFNDNSSDIREHRTRSKSRNGGGLTDWNREHTYPKSKGTPNLEESGPGADAHHLRPADVRRNSNRGNYPFADASGNSRRINNSWYPGDEWKGDCARMMMYMYIRYGTRCLPSNVGVGSNANTPDDMIDLFLKWNAEDPVSAIEIARNNYHGNTSNTYAQGNRNPFIDNPYLATIIWGGTPAENRWTGGGDPNDTEAPTTPTNLVASGETSTSINLNWTASTDNSSTVHYNIHVNNSLYTTSSTNTATVQNLTPSTTYQFTVYAIDATGNISGASNTVSGTTLAGNASGSECVAESFEGIDVNTSSYTDITWVGDNGFSWTATEARSDQDINGSKAITIKFGSQGSLTSASVPDGIGSLTLSTKRIFSGGNGTLDVYVNNQLVGNVPYTNEEETTTLNNINVEGNVEISIHQGNGSDRVAIDDLSWTCYTVMNTPNTTTNSLSIYPNPVKNENLYLELSQPEKFSYKMYDINGRLVKQKKQVLQNRINTANLTNGLYFLHLEQNGNTYIKKVQISR